MRSTARRGSSQARFVVGFDKLIVRRQDARQRASLRQSKHTHEQTRAAGSMSVPHGLSWAVIQELYLGAFFLRHEDETAQALNVPEDPNR